MEIIFSITENEVKKINVRETENLAMELVGCYVWPKYLFQ
jgi:hypothetical protein